MTVENATTETVTLLPGDVKTTIAGTADETSAETITEGMTISPIVLGTAMAIPREETATTIREIEDTTDGQEAHRIESETIGEGHLTGIITASADVVEAAARQTGLRGTTEIDLVRMAEEMSDKMAGVEVLLVTANAFVKEG